MVLSKIRKEAGKVKMQATVELQRKANVQWILDNRSDLTENYPNRWMAVENQSVQIVDIDIFTVFKIMDMRECSPATVYYLCNEYQSPVILVKPSEVWQDATAKSG